MKPSFDADITVAILSPKREHEAAKDYPSYLSIRLDTPSAPFTLDFRTADVIFVSHLIDDLKLAVNEMNRNPNNTAFAGREEVVTDPDRDVKLTELGLIPVPPQGGNNPKE